MLGTCLVIAFIIFYICDIYLYVRLSIRLDDLSEKINRNRECSERGRKMLSDRSWNLVHRVHELEQNTPERRKERVKELRAEIARLK